MSEIDREIKTLRKNQKKILEVKNNVTGMKNAFNGLISRLKVAEEKLLEVLNICQYKFTKIKCREKKLI